MVARAVLAGLILVTSTDLLSMQGKKIENPKEPRLNPLSIETQDWAWDKRWTISRPPPRNLPHPPWGSCELLGVLIRSFNEAFDYLDCWDEYAASNMVHRRQPNGTCSAVTRTT